jgi:hypothetical protein
MANRVGCVGEKVTLNVAFYKNGVPADPFAVKSIKIYKTSVRDDNLVTEIIFPGCTDNDYKSYLNRIIDTNIPTTGNCGTESDPTYIAGSYEYELCLDRSIFTSGVYFDVWCFIGDETGNNCVSETGSIDCENEDNWSCQCNKFFVQDCGWTIDDDLTVTRLGFEPLDTRFVQPEKRYLEVSYQALPIYDFDYKKVSAIMPQIRGTITIESQNCEVLVDSAPMSIGLRSGSYRSNPYTLRYMLDSTKFIKGTYRYRVVAALPNGQTISSGNFNLTIR